MMCIAEKVIEVVLFQEIFINFEQAAGVWRNGGAAA